MQKQQDTRELKKCSSVAVAALLVFVFADAAVLKKLEHKKKKLEPND